VVNVALSVQGTFTTPLPDESTCKPYVLPFVVVTSLAATDCVVSLNNFSTPVAVALAALAEAPVIVILFAFVTATETVPDPANSTSSVLESVPPNLSFAPDASTADILYSVLSSLVSVDKVLNITPPDPLS